MKKIIKAILALSLLVTSSVLANFPSKEEIVNAKGTFSGVLKNLKGGPDWSCTATVAGDGIVHVKWQSNEATYTGTLGPAGGKAGSEIVMNARGNDNSEVRFVWNSLNEMEVQWWPNMAAKAGQTQHQPPHVAGKIVRQ